MIKDDKTTNDVSDEEINSLLKEARSVSNEVDKISSQSNKDISSLEKDIDNDILDIDDDIKELDSVEEEAMDNLGNLIKEEAEELSQDQDEE